MKRESVYFRKVSHKARKKFFPRHRELLSGHANKQLSIYFVPDTGLRTDPIINSYKSVRWV